MKFLRQDACSLPLEEPVPNIAAHMLLRKHFFVLCQNFTKELEESLFNPVGKSHIVYTFTPPCLKTTIIIHSPHIQNHT